MHANLIGMYVDTIRQHQIGAAIIPNKLSLDCITMINPTTGWFKIVQLPCFDLEEITAKNNEYTDKLYSRVIQMFNQVWLPRYPCPREFMFDNIYEFKRY